MTTQSSHSSRDRTSSSGLVALGVAGFAGVMLATVSVFQILEGIAAIADDKVYVAGISYAYELDLTTWGWIHLILGVIGLAVGLGILAGQAWGLLSGVVIAALSCLTHFAFLPYFPIWSLVVLAFNALVIWALCSQISRESLL
jgi:hypothetical protein